MRTGIVFVLLVLAAAACNDGDGTSSGPTTPGGPRRFDPRPLTGGCGEGQETERYDLNRDGRPDFTIATEPGGTCRAVDMNFDGSPDLYRHRDAAGNFVREEADLDYDGQLDAVALQGSSGPTREEFDTNWDGKVDFWVELLQPCAFQAAPTQQCVTSCGIPWCAPRRLPAPSYFDEEEMAAAAAAGRVPRCDDRIRNGQETDMDCGGPCPPCEDGNRCDRSADCQGGFCSLGYCGAALPVAVLYRDANADALWDTAEVLLGQHPICVAFNTNLAGDSPDNVRPETIEVYRPAAVRSGRADIDYVRKHTLDSNGDPIERCEDVDGILTDCPVACGP